MDVNWVIYVLVAATPISGPALVYITCWASLVAVLPTTFTIAKVWGLFIRYFESLQCICSFSRLCIINITNVFSSKEFDEYSNSEANTTSVGLLVKFQKRYFTKPEKAWERCSAGDKTYFFGNVGIFLRFLLISDSSINVFFFTGQLTVHESL